MVSGGIDAVAGERDRSARAAPPSAPSGVSGPALAGAIVAAVLLLGSCRDDAAGPGAAEYAIEVDGGDGQIGAVDGQPPEPLAVRVTDARTGEAVEDVYVSWRVIDGFGASVVDPISGTDSTGVATTRVLLGPDTGSYRVAAATNRLFGDHTTLSIHAILAPRIDAIEPATAAPGDTVTIIGERFAEAPAGNTVLFGGFPGEVVGGGPTEVRAVVPDCLPSRSVDVTVQRGAVVGTAVGLDVDGEAEPPVAMDVGDVLRLDGAALDCTALAGDAGGAAYLIVAQNAVSSPDRAMPFRLVGLTGTTGGTLLPSSPATASEALEAAPAPLAWEARVRARERGLSPAALPRPERGPRIADGRLAVVPGIGDRDTFSVLNKDEEFTTVVAEVKHVGEHAVLYQDLDAPAGGFSAEDFERFGDLFDDPIYATDVEAFGQPSDIDENGRIVVLFTPVVNALTDRGRPDQGFVAGFFFGYDLSDGVDSNRAEIFYSLVPDPEAEFSDERTVNEILRVVPSVLAHELQHMIAFNQRRLRQGSGQDDLWLSEALAHMAEDLVADRLLARGDTARGVDFVIDNVFRAHLYLRDPSATALVQREGLGSLELRGAGWLFLKYAMGRFGGVDLLRRLTQTPRAGVANVTAETGEAWADLMHPFAVALWADDPGNRANAPIDPSYTFADYDLRDELEFWFAWVGADPDAAYSLAPEGSDYRDLEVVGSLASSSPGYVIVEDGAGPVPPLGLALTGAHGLPLGADVLPQLSILRYR